MAESLVPHTMDASFFCRFGCASGIRGEFIPQPRIAMLTQLAQSLIVEY